MCFPFDALPPDSDGSTTQITDCDLTLTARDGTPFAAFLARPEGTAPSGGIGVVVLPDVRGLFGFYEELARGFARQGMTALTIDYFGRTAGVGKRDAEFEFMPHVRQTTPEGVSDDVGAAVAHLRSPEGGACTSIFTIGFCFGGSNSWLQAANGHGLAGVIGFYGRPGPSFVDNSPGPVQRVDQFRAPVLALMGGADKGIPVEQVHEFDEALTRAGVEHEVVIYDGAPHSFFDRAYKEFADDSRDAWERVLSFITRHAGTPAGAR